MATSISASLREGVATGSAAEARALAAAWIQEIPADSTLALHGDLGAGKTTWVQGLAEGLGISGPVTSPTFTIFNLHRGTRLLAHLDAYRLDSADQVEGLLLEEFLHSPWVLAVEWPERVSAWLPPGAWHLHFTVDAAGGHRVRLR